MPVSNPQVDAAVGWIAERAGDVLGDAGTVADVDALCRELLDDWDRRRKGLESGGLSYTSDRGGRDPLLNAGAAGWGTWSAGWSLREVEPETNLVISLAAAEVADRPDWTFAPGSDDAATIDESDEVDEVNDDVLPADEAGLLAADPVPAANGEPPR